MWCEGFQDFRVTRTRKEGSGLKFEVKVRV
jgi:hypothetical protein